MASEFKIKNGLIVIGDVSTSGTITINGALAATQSYVASQGYLTSASLTSYATQSYVTSAIASLVDSAPGALDTLRELATALGNDASFSTTVTNSIAAKLPLAGGTLTGALSGTSATFSSAVSVGNLRAGITNTIGWTGQGGFESITDGNFRLYNEGRNTYGNLTLGAATLNGALTGTSATFSGDLLTSTSGTSISNTIQFASGNVTGQIRGQFVLQNPAGTSVNANDAYIWRIAAVGGVGNSGSYNSNLNFLRTTRNGVTDESVLSLNGYTGNVGIGTTNPLTKLWIEGNDITLNTEGSSQAKTLYFRYSNGAAVNADSYLTFGTGGSPIERMRITSSGNVGIGTTSPTYKLEVNGNLASLNSSAAGLFAISGTRSIAIQSFAGDWNYIRSNNANLVFGTQDAANLYIRTNDTDRIFVNTVGKVAIGTTDTNSDKSDFTVYTGAGATIALTYDQVRMGGTDVNWSVAIRQDGSFETYGQALNLKTSNGNYPVNVIPNGTTSAQFYTDYTYFPGLDFAISRVNSTHGAANYFRGDTGHLVIGTGGTLYLNYAHTSGTTYIFGTTYVNNEQVATRAWVGAQGYITSYSETDTLASVTGRGASTSTNITFNGTITANSSIVQGYGNILTGYNAGFQITVNATYSGGQTNTYTPQYAGGASAGMFVMKQRNGGEGIMDFYGKQSGTDGSTQAYSTFNHLMTMLPTGNVGIGTTAPSTKLEVGNFLDAVTNKITVAARYEYEPEFNFKLGQSGTNYDWIGAVISSGDDGNYNGKILFKTANANRDTPTTKMIIKASGNVGIGTSSPGDYKLYVNGGQFGTLLKGGDLGTGSDVVRMIKSDGSAAMLVRGDGNVGIGTTSPTQLLHIVGTNAANNGITLQNTNASGNSQVRFLNTSGNERAAITYVNGSDAVYHYTAAGGNLLNLVGANVGIGTTSPSEKLHVSGAAIFDGGAGNSSTDSVVYITKSNNNDWGLYVNASGLDYGMYARVSPSAGYAIGINNGTTWTTRITGNAIIYLGEKNAIEGNYDTWLRLNNQNHYTSGVYTPGVMRADGGFQVSGNTVIHSGTIGSQSVSYANSAGSAGYVNNQSGQLYSYDNRTISPSETNAAYLQFGFTSWANNNSAPYADYLHLRSYPDSSGGSDNLVMFLKSGIGMRIWQQSFGSASAYSSYADVWHSGNLTNLNQLSNGPGYLTSYTETDTLATVTSRGNTTATAVNFTSAGGAVNLTGLGSFISFKDQADLWTGYVGFSGNTGNLSFPGRNVEIISGYNGIITLNNGNTGYDSGRILVPYGNVGIGTSPTYKLDVNGSFNAVTSGVSLTYNSGILYHGNYYQFTSGNNYLLYARGGGDLLLGSNDTERVRITSAGNVGIGTTSPSQKLEVNSGGAYMDTTVSYGTNTKGIVINQEDGTGYGIGLWFRQAGLTAGIGSTRVNSGDWATDLRFYTHPSSTTNQNTLYERMRINSEGNVGIGTSSPGAKLHIVGNTYIQSGVLFVDTIAGYVTNLISLAASTNVLVPSGDITIGSGASTSSSQPFGDFSQLKFDNLHSDTNRGPNKIVMHDNGSAWIGGFGIHSDTVSYYTGGHHRWYKTDSQTSSNQVMQLDASGNLSITGTFSASGYNNSNWNTAYSWGNHASAGYLRLNTWEGNSYIGTSGAHYGTIFYDSNDTSYYADPSSTSNLNNLSVVGYQYIGGQTSNGQSNFQWDGATYRDPGDWIARLILRKDNATTGINGSIPSLVIFNNNGANQTTASMVFATNECTSGSNSVNLAGIVAKKESVGNCGNWSAGSLNFFVKNYGARVDSLALTPDGNATFSGLVYSTGYGNSSQWNTAYSWGNHASYSYATTSYVTTQINNLIAGAPGALDTLNELATALGNDASFSTTVTNSIAAKLPLAGGNMTGSIGMGAGANIVFTGGPHAIYGNNTGYLHFYDYTNVYFNNQLVIRGGIQNDTGNVLIDDNLTVTGTITESSSLKLKENVETSEGNLEKVVNLRPVTYNKIGSQTTELGLIAEEVAEVYPEFVQYDENGEPVGVNYSRLTAALIGAVKELTQRIETLENNG